MSAGGFWKPASDQHATSKASNAPLAQQRMLLPIYKHKKQILFAIENYGVVVIVGETACGKSTQIPQYLFENGWCDEGFQVVCTQPRRIAAQTLAQRVSEEVGENKVGGTIGYSVRFDQQLSDSTAVLYMTDGMLLREAQLQDPLLGRYSVVMVDEAHERNLNTDALLGLLKMIRRRRPELRIIVCSATIDAEAFLDFFVPKKTAKRRRRWDNPDATNLKTDSGTIISVDGRQHSVDLLYIQSPTSDYIRSTVETALQISTDEPRGGGILCFLPSGEDCDEAIRMTQDHLDQSPQQYQKLVLLSLYSSLPYHLQARVFQQPQEHQRRIIFSTNIAETSVTVPRITHVVDCGFAKLPVFDPKTQFNRLMVVPISQASAHQRAGRAGRIQAGQCYRLYTEDFYRAKMEAATPPEILRTNLTRFILSLKALAIDNILAFDMLDLPGVDALSHGLSSLFALGAIDEQTQLTGLGWEISSFPTEPRVSRMLLHSYDEDCTREIVGIASVLQVRSIFLTPRQKQREDWVAAMSHIADPSGDHVSYVNAILEQDEHNFTREECLERFLDFVALRRVVEVRKQLLGMLKHRRGRIPSLGTSAPEERSKAIRKCVTAGFFMQVAKLKNDGKYYTLHNPVLVAPSSASIFHSHGRHSEYIIFCETHDGTRGGIELRSVSAIDPRWLREVAPHYWE
jgi:ATP-dependent RNA helicase DDX35